MNKLEQLLCELVSIRSTNPDHSNDDFCGEEEIGDYITDFFLKNGIDCQKQPAEKTRANIIARVEKNQTKRSSSKSILLCSHLDTVYIEGMDFKPVFSEKYINGPGSCDAKASVASMISALADFSLQKERNADVYFLGVVGEESRHIGIKSFLKNSETAYSFDFCVMGEPTNNNIGIAHKGSLRLGLKTRGVNAHGSTPELGVNAIDMMSKNINEINKTLLAGFKKIKDPLLGHPTLNIGVINGGKAFNIVPESCYIEIDRRIIPGEKINDVINDFSCVIASMEKNVDNFKAEILPVIDYVPYLKISEDNAYLNLFQEISCRFSNSVKKIGLPFATDGGFTSEASLPTVVFGPGSIGNAHKLEEFVSIEELHHAKKILYEFISNA